MPNHFHVLLTIPAGATLERALQCIKGGFSHEARCRLGLRSAIWQTSFLDRRVRDATEYARFSSYILQNPVRAGLVVECSDYAYSSISPNYDRDDIPQWLKPQSETAAFAQA
jgi:putative transposase